MILHQRLLRRPTRASKRIICMCASSSQGSRLAAETAWAAEAHADELAQAEGCSRAAREMAVQLCQEYAETLK
ncbi:MAG TPA: hypothetical protein PK170_06855 [Anaerolineae bacterium]|nr:hypothetical protein [Anaerolineae bacterium]